MHHIDIGAHPVASASIGFILAVGKNTSEIIESASLSPERVTDTFILGFVGALGGLTLSLLVKLIKYLINRKGKKDVE